MSDVIQQRLIRQESNRIEQYIHLQKPMTTLHLRVDAQSLTVIHLEKNDQIEFKIPEGQCLELLPRDHVQSFNPKLLETQSQSNTDMIQICAATQTLAQLQQGTQSSHHLAQLLCRYTIDKKQLQHVILIEKTQTIKLLCTENLQLIVINAGLDMCIDQHNVINDIKVIVHKYQALNEYLPEPLAQPVQEIRIPSASARTYEVKAGQWIQIIDVSGKQCSDFLAFDAQALVQGQEIALDAVATRTLLGHSTPAPGLYSRFADSNMQTLIEVIQDTVGRHDMFLTACSPKFYEDSGYFGHVSCTENFNQALKKYAITARTAWPAINFFYNTQIEPCGTISMDEPWSRAGDYVLLRATKDLICASSACPDDIDPSNGWVPTDIHVRIYDATEYFPRANAYRITAEEMPRMTKNTAFYPCIAALTSHLVDYRGYWVASQYDGWGAQAEYSACRERVAMIDLSALRKFEIVGPDAEKFMQFALTRNVRKLAVGEIAYSAICLETGGMLDDGTIFKMGENNFRWICGDDYTGIWLAQQAKKLNYQISIRASTDQIHNLAVQGPNSRELLQKLIWTPEHQPDIKKLAWFHFTLGRLGGPTGFPVMVSRTGYTGELGFEVWCHPDQGKALWDTIWQNGQQYGIAPMGFDALDMLRIEAGLIFANHEFTSQINPFEAGIGFTVPIKSKEENFIGKEAMQNQNPLSRYKLVGLILDQSQAALHGDSVYPDSGHYPVGVITSATNSPILQKQIALCRIAPQYAELGTVVEIGKLDGQQKRLTAQVVSLPFYDPERIRVRS
ncbi:DUF1989 domain-containing protein [Acinetobacter qingfengensis]|uniref:Aminomethyltransferase n=1 Tax=Acinetobacter qingfengensis TaxID=1262585 RepID=A0A1E7RCE4_9GAMM|nr:aminomethyltransferase family protein [Acinetobacter qingfengensis]KAA8735263.1 DUF1989 domain-containing protein [Acinetobacter qingfengensis]OEY96963.1 aminomethyltransferase [Acinetobacter qingfengensis]